MESSDITNYIREDLNSLREEMKSELRAMRSDVMKEVSEMRQVFNDHVVVDTERFTQIETTDKVHKTTADRIMSVLAVVVSVCTALVLYFKR